MSQSDSHNPDLVTLCEADAALLDRLIDAQAAGHDPQMILANLRGPSDDPQRIKQLETVLSLLDQPPVEELPSDLVARTMAKIATHKQRRQLQFQDQIAQFETKPQRAGILARIGRWGEIGVAAAMIIVGISLMFPIVDKTSPRRAGCQANLAVAGRAMGSYASDHDDKLPREGAQQGGIWIRVGKRGSDGKIESNTAQYLLLVRKGYCELAVLACPENPHAPKYLGDEDIDFRDPNARSFSYQNQYTGNAFRLHNRDATGAILADRNPLFKVVDGKLEHDQSVAADSNSDLHQATGQNILLNNLAVMWRDKPVIEKISTDGNQHRRSDNLWTAEGISTYKGNEVPADANDAHLVP